MADVRNGSFYTKQQELIELKEKRMKQQEACNATDEDIQRVTSELRQLQNPAVYSLVVQTSDSGTVDVKRLHAESLEVEKKKVDVGCRNMSTSQISHAADKKAAVVDEYPAYDEAPECRAVAVHRDASASRHTTPSEPEIAEPNADCYGRMPSFWNEDVDVKAIKGYIRDRCDDIVRTSAKVKLGTLLNELSERFGYDVFPAKGPEKQSEQNKRRTETFDWIKPYVHEAVEAAQLEGGGGGGVARPAKCSKSIPKPTSKAFNTDMGGTVETRHKSSKKAFNTDIKVGDTVEARHRSDDPSTMRVWKKLRVEYVNNEAQTFTCVDPRLDEPSPQTLCWKNVRPSQKKKRTDVRATLESRIREGSAQFAVEWVGGSKFHKIVEGIFKYEQGKQSYVFEPSCPWPHAWEAQANASGYMICNRKEWIVSGRHTKWVEVGPSIYDSEEEVLQ